MRTGARAFNTRYGVCHLLPDRIELSRNDLTGKVVAWLYGKGYERLSVLYISLAVVFFLAALFCILIRNYFLTFFFLIFAGLDLYALRLNRGMSFAPVILRENIESVMYYPAVEGVSRAMFTVIYRNGDRKLLRRISLPGQYQNGDMIAEEALRMMRDEGLIEVNPRHH
jgi:hypothetical protein